MKQVLDPAVGPRFAVRVRFFLPRPALRLVFGLTLGLTPLFLVLGCAGADPSAPIGKTSEKDGKDDSAARKTSPVEFGDVLDLALEPIAGIRDAALILANKPAAVPWGPRCVRYSPRPSPMRFLTADYSRCQLPFRIRGQRRVAEVSGSEEFGFDSKDQIFFTRSEGLTLKFKQGGSARGGESLYLLQRSLELNFDPAATAPEGTLRAAPFRHLVRLESARAQDRGKQDQWAVEINGQIRFVRLAEGWAVQGFEVGTGLTFRYELPRILDGNLGSRIFRGWLELTATSPLSLDGDCARPFGQFTWRREAEGLKAESGVLTTDNDGAKTPVFQKPRPWDQCQKSFLEDVE